MADDDVLLDAFVSIRPDPNFMQAIDGMADEAIQRLTQRLGGATIPAPQVQPINPGGGPGGGGPGGGGPGGGGRNPPVNQLTQDYRRLTDTVEDLNRQLRQFKGESGAVNLQAEIRASANEIEDLLTRLRRGARDRDPLGLDGVPDQINEIQRRFDQLGVDVNRVRPLRDLFREEQERARNVISSGRRQSAEQQKFIAGSQTPEVRADIIRINTLIAEREEIIRRASAAWDGQTISVIRLQQATASLEDAQERLAEVQSLVAARRGESFNNLSNNAYQLGQAIEDAAIGYSLNGISGAFRGASNNLSFLLNNLLQTESVAKRLDTRFGAGFGNKIAVFAAIGTAIATLVLPPLIEWLESLDDIESKFEDLSDLISSEFKDVQIDVGLQATEREFLRSIERANELRDVLKSLSDITDKSADSAQDLQRYFEGIGSTTGFDKALEQLKEADRLLTSRRQGIEKEQSQAQVIVNRGRLQPGDIAGGSQAIEIVNKSVDLAEIRVRRTSQELERLVPQIKGIQDLFIELERAREKGISGESTAEQLKRTVELFRTAKNSVQETADQLNLSGDKASEVAKQYEATLSSLEEVIRELSNAAKEIESANNSISEGFTEAERKSASFLEKQKLIRDVIEGTKNQQELFVFEGRKSVEEFDSLITKVQKAKELIAEARGLDKAPIEAEARNLREALRYEAENTLLQRKKEIEEQISAIRDRRDSKTSRSTTFDKYAEDLQIKVLSDDKRKDEQETLDRLIDELKTVEKAIRDLNAAMGDSVFSKLGVWFENLQTSFEDATGKITGPAKDLFDGVDRLGRQMEFMMDVLRQANSVDEALSAARLASQFSSNPLIKLGGSAIGMYQDAFGGTPGVTDMAIPNNIFEKDVMADAVRIGVENGIAKAAEMITKAQGITTEAVKQVDITPRAK